MPTSKSAGMPAAARGASAGAGKASARERGKAKAQGKGTRAQAAAQPLEQRILLTATLCLLAFGAVMVYSASSATHPAAGAGQRHRLPRQVRDLRRARTGADARCSPATASPNCSGITAPLLAVSFVLVLAVHMPHVGCRVNGARRWIGPGIAAVPALRAAEARARALRGATLLARKPQRRARPARARPAAAGRRRRRCLLVVTQPDLGTAMVIAFTTSALLLAAGMSLA